MTRTYCLLSLLLGLAGLGYLYRMDLICRFHAILKNTLLNDSVIALERRKIGLFLLFLSLFFLYKALARPAGPDYGRGVPAQHAFGARPVGPDYGRGVPAQHAFGARPR
ncbi:MAG: hypothetical protein HY402_03580 [Elusimicrobia bacterium]|nr:hypothetical protein [Elusimicrobiota bacterium]